MAVGLAGFLLGNITSCRLSGDLDEARGQRDAETKRADELAQQLTDLDSEIARLEAQLARSGNAKPAEPTGSGEGLAEIGESRPVGTMVITPTSFSRISSAAGTATYRATMSVKNSGSEGINPFCGEEGGLVDSAGRTFDAESDLDLDASNCGDDIQPGLTRSNYRLEFTLPGSAKPVILKLWGDLGFEDSPALWNVKGL